MLDQKDLEAIAGLINTAVLASEERTIEKIIASEERTTEKILASAQETKKEIFQATSESEERTTEKILASEERTTEKILASEERTTEKILASEERTTEKILASAQETKRETFAYIENVVDKKIQVLAEGISGILKRLPPENKVEDMESNLLTLTHVAEDHNVRILDNTEEIQKLKATAN